MAYAAVARNIAGSSPVVATNKKPRPIGKKSMGVIVMKKLSKNEMKNVIGGAPPDGASNIKCDWVREWISSGWEPWGGYKCACKRSFTLTLTDNNGMPQSSTITVDGENCCGAKPSYC